MNETLSYRRFCTTIVENHILGVIGVSRAVCGILTFANAYLYSIVMGCRRPREPFVNKWFSCSCVYVLQYIWYLVFGISWGGEQPPVVDSAGLVEEVDRFRCNVVHEIECSVYVADANCAELVCQ